jgi:hypothetical protein
MKIFQTFIQNLVEKHNFDTNELNNENKNCLAVVYEELISENNFFKFNNNFKIG